MWHPSRDPVPDPCQFLYALPYPAGLKIWTGLSPADDTQIYLLDGQPHFGSEIWAKVLEAVTGWLQQSQGKQNLSKKEVLCLSIWGSVFLPLAR